MRKMVNIVSNGNCVYQIAYHVVWCSKYRQDVLTGEIADELGAILNIICAERRWSIISKEIQPDYINLLVSIPPKIAVASAIKILKGVTARLLFKRFPQLKDRLRDGHLWSPSYYVGTAGNISAEVIQSYIERFEHVTESR
jgi:putative transposase